MEAFFLILTGLTVLALVGCFLYRKLVLEKVYPLDEPVQDWPMLLTIAVFAIFYLAILALYLKVSSYGA